MSNNGCSGKVFDDGNDDFGFVERDADVVAKTRSGSMQSNDSTATHDSVSSEGKPDNGAGRAEVNVDAGKSGSGLDGTPPNITSDGVQRAVKPQSRIAATTVAKTKSSEQRAKRGADMSIATELPKKFEVKYLGKRDARGLWGIKHTRKPVDDMVADAKKMSPDKALPFVELVVSDKGVKIAPGRKSYAKNFAEIFHTIDSISYGVQDLVYTRVFSMIIVREISSMKGQHPFECHAFVCDSRVSARQLTYALASAFQEYSKSVKAGGGKKNKKFAIDLRTPEEIEEELKTPQAKDSEA